MPLYIRDDEVKGLADRLAEQRGCNVTEAVRSALKDALKNSELEVAARKAKLQELLARFDTAPQLRPGFTDSDLYDETGDPIL